MSQAPREKFVRKLHAYLLREHSPRFEMAVALSLTGLAGFLATAGLLRMGLETMWIRYSLSVIAGYAIFLLMVWALVAMYRTGADAALSGESETGLHSGTSQLNPGDVPDPTGCLDVPGDEGCAVIAAIAVVFSLLVIAIYFIASAPTLFAEVMLDSLLVGGLYHRLRRYDESRWFLSAIRHTIIPAIILIIVLALAGVAFSTYAPEANSIGGVFNHWRISH